jgi:hypothetical protein
MTCRCARQRPLYLAVCLDRAGSEKAAGIPLIVLADTPGYLPGRGQESRLRSSTVFGLVENFTVLMVFATSVAYFLRRTVYVAIPSRPSQDQDHQHLDSARSSAA